MAKASEVTSAITDAIVSLATQAGEARTYQQVLALAQSVEALAHAAEQLRLSVMDPAL